ncbi:MAG: hypothetical protein NZM00_01000, partial [Anaerolinea sp.]|nr:hypothetical protein [Anaerolinea sp.]
MSDQSALPRFADDDAPAPDPGRVIRSQASRSAPPPVTPSPVSAVEKLTARSWLATLDLPIIIVVLLLLSIGG